MHHPTDMIARTTSFVKPVVEHWLEQEIAYYLQYQITYNGKRYCYSSSEHFIRDDGDFIYTFPYEIA